MNDDNKPDDDTERRREIYRETQRRLHDRYECGACGGCHLDGHCPLYNPWD